MKLRVLAFCLALMVPSGTGFAQWSAFLQLAGAPGGSLDTTNHAGWMDVTGASVANIFNPQSGPNPSVLLATFQNGLLFTKNVDSASPVLALECGQGSSITLGTLDITPSTNTAVPILRVQLTNVFITAVSDGYDSSSGAITEQVSLQAQIFAWAYAQFNTNGLATNNVNTSWNFIYQSPTITSAASNTFSAGVPGSFTATASGNPAPIFAETGALPNGVTLSPFGVLSGTPAQGTSGSYPLTLNASNGVLPGATQSFTLTVNPTYGLITAADGSIWYLGPDAIGADWHIYREAPGQIRTTLDGAASRIGQANDGTVLVENSSGGVYARIGSTNGPGSYWELLASVTAGDGATWFLGADGTGTDNYIYRWAANGAPTYTSGAATQISTTPDDFILVQNSSGTRYLRVGSYAGIGSYWELLTESLVVTTTVDENNGTSDSSVGTGTSLREALIYAATLSGPQTITFAPSLASQTVTLTNGWTGAGDTSALVISNTVTIQGLTASPGVTLAIGSGGQRRHFYVNGSAALTLANLMLTGGYATNYGGSVWCFGSLTVSNCTFTGNYAGQEGGAIQTWGTVSPFLLVQNSTIASNISGSYASGIGDGSAQSIFDHVTMVDNVASASGCVLWIYNTIAALTNSIIARNTHDGVQTYGIGAFSAQSANNLLGIGNWAGLANGINGNLVGVASAGLGLGTLANNGGPTPTVALLPSSPAINAGTSADGVATDQRGVARPQGVAPDIGAYEFYEAPSLAVTTTNDVVNPYDGLTSLREAVAYADSLSGAQTITFSPALTSGGPAAITLTNGQISVSGDVIVTGPGANLLTVSGNHAGRVFTVSLGAGLSLAGLTVANGFVDSGGGTHGAGIDNQGSLLGSECVFSGNISGGANACDGGAIYHEGPALTLSQCTFAGNQALGGGYGGGLAAASGAVAITACTFYSNTASAGNGGGIVNYSSVMAVTNSTFEGNSAYNGGGILHYGATTTLDHCTIVSNTASYTGGGIERVGRGLGNPVNLINNLIAGNLALQGGPDAFSYPDTDNGIFTSFGYNLVGNGSGTIGVTNGINGDLVGAAANHLDVGPLTSNGGPTLTMALLPGSPAINAGTSADGVTTDQRGVVRDPYPDIGAFEYVYPLLIPAFNHVSLQPVYGRDYRLIYQGSSGDQYILQQTYNLMPADWLPVATNPAGSDGTASFIITPTPRTNTFWRVAH